MLYIEYQIKAVFCGHAKSPPKAYVFRNHAKEKKICFPTRQRLGETKNKVRDTNQLGRDILLFVFCPGWIMQVYQYYTAQCTVLLHALNCTVALRNMSTGRTLQRQQQPRVRGRSYTALLKVAAAVRGDGAVRHQRACARQADIVFCGLTNYLVGTNGRGRQLAVLFIEKHKTQNNVIGGCAAQVRGVSVDSRAHGG